MATKKSLDSAASFLFICHHVSNCNRLIHRRFCSTQKSEEVFFMSGYQALQKKHTKIKSANLAWNPQDHGLKTNECIASIGNAEKPHQVMSIVSEALKSEQNGHVMSNIYNCAIRKCVEFEAYPQCWNLFVQSKQTKHINTMIYTTMIWMNLNSSRRAHFNKAMELYQEMKKNEYFISAYTYAALIRGCATKLCYQQGIEIWKDAENDKTFTPDVVTWNAIINLYCFNKDMMNAAQCYHDMQHKAHIMPDNYTYKSLLNGYGVAIANVIKHNIKGVDIDEYLTMAENVFYDAVMAWNDSNRKSLDDHEQKKMIYQRMNVIQSWMNVYASMGDIHGCLIIFKWLLKTNYIQFEYDGKIVKGKKKKQDLEQWLDEGDNGLNGPCYTMRIQIFGLVLKACLNQPKLMGDKLNKLLVSVMDVLLDKCDIKPSTDIYGMLFQLYARLLETVDIEQLENLYQDMLTKCDSKPTERELNDYARTYLTFMQHNGATNNQKQDFLAILIKQFKDLKVTPSIYTKQLIQEYSN